MMGLPPLCSSARAVVAAGSNSVLVCRGRPALSRSRPSWTRSSSGNTVGARLLQMAASPLASSSIAAGKSAEQTCATVPRTSYSRSVQSPGTASYGAFWTAGPPARKPGQLRIDLRGQVPKAHAACPARRAYPTSGLVVNHQPSVSLSTAQQRFIQD